MLQGLMRRRKSRETAKNSVPKSIEAFERRELMAAGFLQGLVTVGTTPLPGAVVTLYSMSTNAQVGSPQTTGSDGSYLFTGLGAGGYKIVETPPTGYAASTSSSNTQLDVVNGSTSSSFNVYIADPSASSNWLLNTAGSNQSPVYFSATNPNLSGFTNVGSSTGSTTVNVVETDGGYTTPNFNTFCVDLNRDIFPDPNSQGNQNTNLPYTVEPLAQKLASIAGTSAANAGRIAYLFNHDGQLPLTAAQAAGLQLAIWELEYDASPGDVASGAFEVAAGTDPSIVSAANGYLSDSAGKDELAVFLDGLPFSAQASGSQGLLATGSFNFTNVAAAPPANSSICGTVYCDASGNGLNADNSPKNGDTPESHVTVTLLNASGQVVATAVTGNDGKYSFTNLPYGTYTVKETTPNGQVETGPTSFVYTATTSSTNTKVANENFSNYMTCSMNDLSCVYYSVTTNGRTKWVNDLKGNTSPGSVVTAYFTVARGKTDTLSLVSYIAPSSSFSAATASQQQVFCYQTQTYTGGQHSLTVTIPKSYFQIDFVCGQVISHFGPAGSNVFYTPEQRLFSSDNGGSQAYNANNYRGCSTNYASCDSSIFSGWNNNNGKSWCWFLNI